MQSTPDMLPETNDWAANFPQSFDEYFQDKPSDVSYLAWLIHPLNPYKFTPTIKEILSIIEYKSRRENFTFFYQETLAEMVGYSERWVRELLNRLTDIGILQNRKVHKNRQMQIIPRIKALLFGQQPTAEPSIKEINEMLREAAEQERQTSNQPRGQAVVEMIEQAQTLTQNLTDSDARQSGKNSIESSGEQEDFVAVSNSKQDSLTASTAPLKEITKNNISSKVVNISGDDEQTIIQLFEQYTGSKFVAKRDSAALVELKGYDKVVVEIGMLESALLAPAKINTLKYMLGQVRAYHQATQPQFIAQQSKEKGVTLSVLGTETLLIILKSRRHRWAKRQESLKQV